MLKGCASKAANKRTAVKSNTKKQQKTQKKSLVRTQKRKISTAQALFGTSNEKKIPLDFVHPDAVLPKQGEAFISTSAPKISVLSNGIKVVTADANLPISHITLSINAGSRFEMVNDGVNGPEEGEGGFTHLMERAIIRTTKNRLTGTLVRDMAKLGADLEASAGRENFTITASTPTRINPVLGAVADIVKNAAYDFVDLRQDINYYNQDSKRRDGDHDTMLNETLHLAAFGPTPLVDVENGPVKHFGLGNSLYMPQSTLAKVTPAKMRKFHDKFMVANRMTLGAVGVNHESFVALAEEMFGGIAKGSAESEGSIPSAPTAYVAGNLRLHDTHHTDNTSIALAWNAPSLLSTHLAAANVLQAVLGGGASFSSGGPGKGMYSRLYRNILQSYDFVESVDSFYTTYTDAGLFGVSATVPQGSAGEFTEVMLQEMASLPTTITGEEVNRAKNMLKTQLLTHMSEGLEQCEEMTRNVQIFGQYQFPTFLQQIENIQTKDVVEIAKLIIEQDITVATHGDASDMPRDVSM